MNVFLCIDFNIIYLTVVPYCLNLFLETKVRINSDNYIIISVLLIIFNVKKLFKIPDDSGRIAERRYLNIRVIFKYGSSRNFFIY